MVASLRSRAAAQTVQLSNTDFGQRLRSQTSVQTGVATGSTKQQLRIPKNLKSGEQSLVKELTTKLFC